MRVHVFDAIDGLKRLVRGERAHGLLQQRVRLGVAAEAATKRAAESSAASSAASSSTPMAPRALVPSPSAPSGPTPPGAQEESEFVGEVQLSIYAGEQLFLEPADVQLEATFGGQPCRVELAQAPERALQAHLEVRWSGAARSGQAAAT